MRSLLFLAVLLALPLAAFAQPAPERVRFESLDLVEGEPVRIEGLLFVPEGAAPEGGRAAVIALHGCGGIYSDAKGREGRLSARHAAQARSLVAAGYAVLLPDSFGPRGRREVCTIPSAERTIRPAQRRLDALGALRWLGRQADIDPSRIALLGWSHGGSTTLAAVNAADPQVAAFREARDAPPFFRTAIAFYPGCNVSLRDARWKPAVPLAILIGADDDWTPAAPCEALGVRGRDAKWPLEVTVYPGAHHGFDAPGGEVRLLRNVPNGAKPGEGVHVGPNPKAREEANAKVAAILREALAR
ncbi:MAG: dienelactone hydrolase family protein [Betaproteobacteria bacterium]|jgi:dienelactone hydrolase|nr:dienelactone hydrolase family protein [Betaproteobacteria bacterium]MDH5286285.1 dienelactone hydrolase family protein [Betaproteobacteria bacterium]